MNKKLCVLLCFICAFVMFMTACDNGGGSSTDTTAPVITVENVPESGINGRPVTVPEAKATDDKDGDISSKVKLTVAQLKEDGSIKKELLYQVTGNVKNVFTPSGNLMQYSIVFTVKDSAGNKAEKRVDFTAVPDQEKPEITLDTKDFPDFDINTGIVNQYATKDITLPTASAKDAPGDFDISDNINVSIINADTNEYVKTFYGLSELVPFRLIRGNYRVEYSCADGAGNQADKISFPLVVNKLSDGENLAQDKSNFAEGYNVVYNQYGEYEVGLTSNSSNQTINSSCVTFKADKVYNDIVAVRIKMDPLGESGGETLYDFSFRGSKNYEYSEPTGKEGEWAPYLVYRYDNNAGMKMYAFPGNGSAATIDKNYDGRIDDGKDHTLYFQIVNVGENSMAEGAKIVMRLWVDTLPSEAPSMEGHVMRGDATGNGTLIGDVFDKMWDAYGWFSVGSIASQKDNFGRYNEDKMLVKGVTLYDETTDADGFTTDIVAPEFTFTQLPAEKSYINEEISFPMPKTMSDGKDISDQVKVYLTDTQGVRVEVIGGKTTVREGGVYTLTYEVKDENNNWQHQDFTIRFMVHNDVKPVIDVDTKDITVEVNQEFTLPVATASDDLLGDITSQIVIDLEGPQSASYINYNNNTSYAIGAVGDHALVYWVEDQSENKAEVRIKVHVQARTASQGNVLVTDADNVKDINKETHTVIVGREAFTMYNGLYISNERVSMIVNAQNGELFMIGVHGMFNNNGIWLDTMTASFAPDGTIYLSLKGYSDYLIATAKNANVFVKDWYQNVDVRIDYQTEIVERNGKDTLHFTLWINDTIIEFTAKEGTNTEIDSDGSILLAVEDIPEKYGNALSAGKFFLGCQNQNLTLKQLHVDGKTFCETPEIPEEPEGFEMPAFGAQGTVNEDALDNVVLLDHASSILTASNQDRVYLKFTVGGAGIGSIYMFQLTGSNPADAWGMSALSLMLNNNTLYIGNGWGKSIIGKAFDYEAGGTYMLSYKLTYVTNANTGKFIGMRVEVWTVVEKDGAPAWEKLSFNVENAYKDFDFGTDMTAPVIPYNILDNASRIKPGPLVVSSLANGEASITILQASVDTEIAPELPQAPEEPEGLPYPTFPTDNYVSETISLAGEGFDSLCDYLPDGEMLYFTVNLNYASGATPWFYLQLTGAAEQVWPQGVILEFNVNGNIFLHVDGNMSTTNYLCYASYAYAQNVDMKLAVKIEYVKDGELVTGMKIFVYQDTGSGYEKLTFANNNATDCVVDGEAVLPSHYLTENNIKPSKVVASFAGVGAADSSVLVKDIRLGETA